MTMEIDTEASEYNDIILRPMHCKLNANTRSDGSTMLTQGNYNFAGKTFIETKPN